VLLNERKTPDVHVTAAGVTWHRPSVGRLVSALAAFCVLGFAGTATAQPAIEYPELIVHNGKIVTMDDTSYSTEVGRVVQAMAIRRHEVLALGSDDEILRLAGPKTQKINLKGRTVIPGIVNAHTHIHDSAINRWAAEVPEKPVAVFSVAGTTPEEIKKSIEVILRERTSGLRPRQWIFLNLPNQTFLGQNFLQDRALTLPQLDKMMSSHPVILVAHPSYVLNTAAKAKLKDMYGAEPSQEEMDETGFSPMGVEYRRVAVVDDYFRDKIDLLAKILEEDLMKQVAAGITTFSSHIMGARYFDAYTQLVRQNRMPLRFAYTHYMGSVLNPGAEFFAARMGDMAGLGNDYFWQTGVGGGYIDHGPPMICTSIEAVPDIKKREWCRMAPGTIFSQYVYNGLKNRVRVAIGHNYGDKTADYFMDMLDRLINEEGLSLEYIRSRRFSMDHCGLYPRPDQLPRLKKFGIMLSCGSNILTRSYPWIEKYGMQYADWLSPVKTALDAGVKVVFESEGAIENGLFSAFTPYITRRNQMGKIVSEKNAVDRNIVMKMATSWSAEFALREDKIGTLQEGMWADFLVLNKDYFAVPVEEISTIYPVITGVGGKIVYVRSDQADELGLKPFGNQLRYNWESGARPAREGDGEAAR